jgi:hypothetical protein
MSKKEEKAKQPLKDVTGKELSDEALKGVAGGMRPRGGGGAGVKCVCQIENKAGNIDAANNPG